jgi:hypothetical protein
MYRLENDVQWTEDLRNAFKHGITRAKIKYDNIEINQVSDCIALWAMEDDSPKYCEHFYMSARGDKSRTEVYVIPREEFGEFVKIRDNMPKEGVKLYDFRH